MPGRLQDRIAIITGAGSVGPGWGNGRATCVRFAEEGAKVFAVDRDPASTAETIDKVKAVGGEIVVHECDVTDSAAVKAMTEACLARYGRIDILVNNVGGSAPGGAVDLTEENWDRQIDYNLKTVFLACKAVLEGFTKMAANMFNDFAGYSSMLPPFRYENTDHLKASMIEHVIAPLTKKEEEIAEHLRAFSQ